MSLHKKTKQKNGPDISCVRETLSPLDFLRYQDFLKQVYLFLKENQKKYSYLQLSEDLGFSRTNIIHLIINNKRPLSLKGAQKISENLKLKDPHRSYWESLVSFQNSSNPAERDVLMEKMLKLKSSNLKSEASQKNLRFFSQWYHAVIYEMTFLKNFSSDPHWICQKLHMQLRPEQAKTSLELLESLNYIKFSTIEKRHFPTQNHVTTPEEVKSIAIMRYHQMMILLGKDVLEKMEASARDISAVTVSVSEDKLPLLKEEISKFRKRIMAISDSESDADMVYQINFQLFPLLKCEEKPQEKQNKEIQSKTKKKIV